MTEVGARRAKSPRAKRRSEAGLHAAPNVVREVREELGVTRRVFARLTGYSERAIAAWESGRVLGDASQQRIFETRRVAEALGRVMAHEKIADWLNSPNDSLGGLKPLETIERGEVDRIWRIIFYLESGVAS